MEEVAWLDGANPLRTVISIILPQAAPGIFTAGIFTFVACWAEFLMALTLDNDDQHRTIPVGMALFGGQFTTPYGTVFAAVTVAVLPIALIVLVFRRAIVSGLTAGASLERHLLDRFIALVRFASPVCPRRSSARASRRCRSRRVG
ncbi:carbohydrate ABC transporter permease [Streptomyces endocoffeicus]|uniref:carbohydrate ABC transporter permease n=1 Tax=Streptomyces endocoffeicus TaxID=2898945 RepID=UPI001E37AF6F|nr:ABC transporter permease subunit [Streptomyces endocoffeicus]